MTGARPQLEAEVQNVFGSLTHAAVFLIVTINPGGADKARQLLADVTGLERTVGSRSLGGALSCVAGISTSAWDRLYGDPRPAELHDLPVFAGERHQSVTTDGDLMFHIRAERMDLCFELATLIMDGLAGAATIIDEVQGFRYFDGRDVLGSSTGRRTRSARRRTRRPWSTMTRASMAAATSSCRSTCTTWRAGTG